MMAVDKDAVTERIIHLASKIPDLQLQPDQHGVEISYSNAQLRFRHSFIEGSFARRARQSTQALLKACNNKQRNIDRILDLTAGWGIDSFTLAWHGQQVTLLENCELLYQILAYSHSCLAAQSQTEAAAASRMSIKNINSINYLLSLPPDDQFDCIYLDPMFPRRRSGAKPAREMQILQALTSNTDIDDCFDLALQKAGRRVVVKRPLKAPSLSTSKPDMVYREKTVRFDIYLTR